MSQVRPSEAEEIEFETRDSEIFRIPDTKTRLETLQNYFFPRLELLLIHSLKMVQEVYRLDPYEKMTHVYRPSHRKAAVRNIDHSEVYVGLAGKRQTDPPLVIRHPDGTPFAWPPSYLTFTIAPQGAIRVVFRPFIYKVDEQYIEAVRRLFSDHIAALLPLLASGHLSYSTAGELLGLCDSFSLAKVRLGWGVFSPLHFFPVKPDRSLDELVVAFLACYPLLDSCVLLAAGESPRLSDLLNRFKTWYTTPTEQAGADRPLEASLAPIELPELGSYTFIRAGLWWQVLARDKWTCRSCGRSPKDGVLLQVDHILPRSLGGSDDISNLQTLCKKCNIGKSNKDQTDLRNL